MNRIAHDLKSPLTTAMLMADLIGLDDTGVDQRLEYLDILRKQLRREQEILETLLTATRVEVGRGALANEPLDIEAIVARSIEIIRPSAEAKNITLTREKRGQSPQMSGDADALATAFSEVMKNAVMCTPEDGEIRVFSVLSEESFAVVFLDSGPGIAPEDQELLFEPYFRGAVASALFPERPGLGLFLTKRVVEGHGGWVVAGNASSGGAQIEVHLPLLGCLSHS